jgi:dihydroorotase
LLKGLKDGSIDLIVSDHQPMNPERKDLEFQAAGFGAISLETAYSLMRTSLPEELSDELWVEKVAINPRKILGLNSDGISEGAEADLTLFDPGLSWTYRNENVRSLSRNSPLLGRNLVGKALGIVKKDQLITPQN